MGQTICQHAGSAGAFHDGELPPSRRQRFEEHLGQCPACAAELAALRAVSGRLREAELPHISMMALARLHQGFRVEGDAAAKGFNERAVLRLAEWLTGAAAAVLVAGLVGLFRPAPSSAGAMAPLPWERVAVTLQYDAQSSGQDPTQFVEWQPADVP